MKTLSEILTKYKDAKPMFSTERMYPISAVIDMIEEAKEDALLQARERAMQLGWISCQHKVVLPAGDYLLRLEYNGFDYNRQFTVTERQKQLEVPYFNVVAYYKVPTYQPPKQ